MPIDPADRRPAYVQVAADLRRQITSGALKPGDLLPSLTRLMETHGVAVNTARNAVKLLEKDGLVVTRQGHGSIVLERSASPQQSDNVPDDLVQLFHELKDAVDDLRDRMEAVEQALQGRGAVQPGESDH
ncbi:GntR family transcriptional regulator [Streptoalloteichus hindustanus]|uniref:MutL C terminal dimerisation domain-containing protein n=1 Tax=Streptoalloteichus hindustanus TaxID=2017 RepID=A0A1M5QHY5_STRHI|nr:winged helix-turn-helix domain-containing protein [Streptoalloteichus hindustanus]SHH13409.1 MutL C terminal dimerisation domain-containing protein [Streptoalloteichus hindustanus]